MGRSDARGSTRPRELHCIAIANRGEAALRLIRAVKALRAEEGSDLRTLALYTEVDRGAPFVRHADAALPSDPHLPRWPPIWTGSVFWPQRAEAERMRFGPAGASWPRTPSSRTQ